MRSLTLTSVLFTSLPLLACVPRTQTLAPKSPSAPSAPSKPADPADPESPPSPAPSLPTQPNPGPGLPPSNPPTPPPPPPPPPPPSPAPTSKVGFTAVDGQLYSDGNPIHLHGINWFGLENSDLKLHGLWTGRTMQSFVDQMISLQFNAFRIPVVAETLTSSSSVDGYATPLDELNAFLTYTQSKGVYVLLDLHKCSKDQSPTDKPGPGVGSCSGYTESAWTADLTALATLAKKYSNVVGIDLFNEPYGLTWARWSAMAERAGQAVLQTNPKLLIFVEGVGNDSTAGHDSAFWGENLFEASTVVPNLPRERLIYSPHIYGPSVYNQPYFNVGEFPKNMPAIWDEHYGHLYKQGFNVVVGEFGGKFDAKDKPLQDALIDYLLANKEQNFFFWALNPNSGDTGGLLLDDWKTVNATKYNSLKKLLGQ